MRRKAEFVQDEEALVAVAAELGVSEFKDHLMRWAARVDPDGADELDQARRDDEQLHASETFGGMVRIDGWLEAVGAAIFKTELDRLETKLFLADWADAEDEHGKGNANASMLAPAANRRARALVVMATRSAALDHDAEGVMPTFVVNIISDQETYNRELIAAATGTEAQAHPGRICELENGAQISPRSMLLLAAVGRVRRVLVDSKGAVLEFGTTKASSPERYAKQSCCETKDAAIPVATSPAENVKAITSNPGTAKAQPTSPTPTPNAGGTTAGRKHRPAKPGTPQTPNPNPATEDSPASYDR